MGWKMTFSCLPAVVIVSLSIHNFDMLRNDMSLPEYRSRCNAGENLIINAKFEIQFKRDEYHIYV